MKVVDNLIKSLYDDKTIHIINNDFEYAALLRDMEKFAIDNFSDYDKIVNYINKNKNKYFENVVSDKTLCLVKALERKIKLDKINEGRR